MATALEDVRVLRAAGEVADALWRLVLGWEDFERDVVGRQLARAADSVGANVAEACGRYHYGEKVHFLYYARGSLFETKYWLNRSQARGLVDAATAANYGETFDHLARQLNAFAASLKAQRRHEGDTKTAQEPAPTYQSPERPLFGEEDLLWLQSTTSTPKPPRANLQSPISNL